MPSDRVISRFSMAMPEAMLKLGGKLNVPLYRASRGRLFGKVGRAPVLLLTSTGRRSGQLRTAPVLYLADRDRLIVSGSNAGNDRAPASSLNLKEKPAAEGQVLGERWPVRARIAEGEERAEMRRAINEQHGGFDAYSTRTARDLPVFVFERAP